MNLRWILAALEKPRTASRQLFMMSFEGMGKSTRMREAPPDNSGASAHRSSEFPAGYSLTRCSPAELVSASPAGVDYAAACVRFRALFDNDKGGQSVRDALSQTVKDALSLFTHALGYTLTRLRRSLTALRRSSESDSAERLCDAIWRRMAIRYRRCQ